MLLHDRDTYSKWGHGCCDDVESVRSIGACGSLQISALAAAAALCVLNFVT